MTWVLISPIIGFSVEDGVGRFGRPPAVRFGAFPPREYDAEYDMEHDARSCKLLKAKQKAATGLAVVLCGLRFC
jgi:hypothetical protein